MFVYVVTVESVSDKKIWFIAGVFKSIEGAEKMAESWRCSNPVDVTKVLLDE